MINCNKTCNSDLITFVSTNIIPLYDKCDKGHGRSHIIDVINRSTKIIEILNDKHINPEIVCAAAAYHDLGLIIGPREIHEINSGILVNNDRNLPLWFTQEEIQIIKEAVEDHRASSIREPRNIYGKIIADADKDVDNIDKIIIRAHEHGRKYYPENTYDEEMQRVQEHLIIKFGGGGYVKFYFPNEMNQNFINTMKEVASNDELFKDIYKRIFPKC